VETLRSEAFAAMEHAYAPYSGFRVGAALLAADGRVFRGCNVENAAYPSGICAERAALGAAIANGARQFHTLVLASEADEPSPPCGMCRQALAEFATALHVVSCVPSGRQQRWNLAQLLPHPFAPGSLGRA
jgi:cytidine deaminase